MSFLIARSLDDALIALAAGARPIAGGSDLVVEARHGATTLPRALVAIDRIRELATIETDDNGCTIGAGVTHARLMNHPAVVTGATALADASALIGSPATRNVGTIGGNIMNGSPAMDTGAPLVVLGAVIELRSRGAARNVAIDELWTGPGQTVATGDELCTTIRLPRRAERSGSAYVRLEYRRAMEIAVVGAAASVVLDAHGAIADASVALAAVAPTIMRVSDLDVAGLSPDEAVDAIMAAASAQARPISDSRASESYRRHTIGVIARRAFEAAVRRARGETIGVPVNHSSGIGASS